MKINKINVSVWLLFGLMACSNPKDERAAKLYSTHCASCHLAPDIQDLPKHLWKKFVLPEMAARMGIKDSTYSPYKGLSHSEQEAMMKTGIFNVRPIISKEDWKLLMDYIIESAPQKLDSKAPQTFNKQLSQFISRPVDIDGTSGSYITFLDIDPERETIITANLAGNIFEYNDSKNEVVRQHTFRTATTSYTKGDSVSFATTVGIIEPSEIVKGKIYQISDDVIEEIAGDLHRPVHTLVHDLNNNGYDELLVSEFGNLVGSLSLWHKKDAAPYERQVLLNQPGIIRTMIKDMNQDGKKDIIALSSQGNEGITILYQDDNFKFNTEQVIRFSPVYGSSWFDLLDYNGDGYDDIIIVHGDNADKTYVHKPYHGMRIYINDGSNHFDEKYFYPLNGATRFVANDFDKDGDIDFGIVSTFPDYVKSPEFSFVYLENIDSDNFKFKTFCLEPPASGRWFLIDADDIDNDGDHDIVLSSFTYHLTPVPKELLESWKESKTDLMILENVLY